MDEKQDSGVVIPEEFQKATHALIHKADKHQLRHVHDRANAREDELRKEEMSNKKPSKTPEEYSTVGMPSSN